MQRRITKMVRGLESKSQEFGMFSFKKRKVKGEMIHTEMSQSRGFGHRS